MQVALALYMQRQVVSSTVSKVDAAQIVSRFTRSTLRLSTRAAGKLVGVSQTTVSGWRSWLRRGEDPAALPMPQPSTLQGIEAYLRIESDVEARRAALTIAAERLEEVVEGLRHEVSSPVAGIDKDRRSGVTGTSTSVRDADVPYRAAAVFDILGALLELDAVRQAGPNPFTAAVAAADRIIASIGSDTLAETWRAFLNVSIDAGHYDPSKAPDWSAEDIAELRKRLPPAGG